MNKSTSERIPARELDEESKALLRRILERTGYRQIMAANIRAHGLKFVLDVEDKIVLARDLEQYLLVLRETERVYASLDGSDFVLATRDQLEKIPYPYSRVELALCLALCDRAERVVVESFAGSRAGEVAAIAVMLLETERESTRFLERMLTDFCADPANHPAAQQFFNRWLAITLIAFGRPDTQGDQRAVALQLRARKSAECIRSFMDEARTFASGLGLHLPDAKTLDIDLPGDVLASFAALS